MIHIDKDRFSTATVGGETFLLDGQTGETFRIGGVGSRLWSMLVAGSTPAEVAEAVASATGASYPRVLDDTLAFIAKLEAAGILRSDGVRGPDHVESGRSLRRGGA